MVLTDRQKPLCCGMFTESSDGGGRDVAWRVTPVIMQTRQPSFNWWVTQTSAGDLVTRDNRPLVITGEHGALAPHPVRVHPDEPVDPDLARPSTPVPGAGADVVPLPARPPLLLLVAVVVLARQGQPHEPVAVVTDDEDRAVLALAVVLLVGHPGPDDLTGVGPTVGTRRIRRVRQAGRVTRVGLRRTGNGRRGARPPCRAGRAAAGRRTRAGRGGRAAHETAEAAQESVEGAGHGNHRSRATVSVDVRDRVDGDPHHATSVHPSGRRRAPEPGEPL